MVMLIKSQKNPVHIELVLQGDDNGDGTNAIHLEFPKELLDISKDLSGKAFKLTIHEITPEDMV